MSLNQIRKLRPAMADDSPDYTAISPSLPNEAGVVLALPKTVKVTAGAEPPLAWLQLDGEGLSADEVKALLASSEGLALIRGQWVEVDGERLGRTMDRFQEAERLAAQGGLTFAEAMRMRAAAERAELAC